MAILEAELVAMKEQKAKLEEKNQALEQAMRLREQQEKYDACPAAFDGQYFVSFCPSEAIGLFLLCSKHVSMTNPCSNF